MNTWLVVAGDGSRDYADVFLRFGVILVGPGSDGDYFTNKDVYNKVDSDSYRQFLGPFAERARSKRNWRWASISSPASSRI